MLRRDFIHLTSSAIISQRKRSLLTALGITVGIAAVVILTSIGAGIHQLILHQFSQFGTNIIAVYPGRSTTHGMPGGIIANTRPLTLNDAKAIERISYIQGMVPVVEGNALAKANGRSRRTTVFGTGPEQLKVWHVALGIGRFLPNDHIRSARALAVLGAKLGHELFGDTSPLGQRIRIGGETFRIIGVLAPKGSILGIDLDDAVYIPAERALTMFNRESLMEIDVTYPPDIPANRVATGIKRLLKARHRDEDFTITTQTDMLETLNKILNILTLAIGALGGISLLVGTVGIFTIMTIAVNERISEVGLLRALGAKRQQILFLFLGEAVFLSSLGGVAGLSLGLAISALSHMIIPDLPTHITWGYVGMAEVCASLIGLIAGSLPAYRASLLDPIEALRTE